MYDSLSKLTQRTILAHVAQLNKKRLLYLDGPDAGATSFFMKQGLDKKLLCPVNNSAEVCKQILAKTSVAAVHDDITLHVKRLADSSVTTSSCTFAAVWLDLECRSVTKETLSASFVIAPLVMVNLATRGTHANAVLSETKMSIKQAGGSVSSMTRYKGRNGVTNMVCVVAERVEKCNKKSDSEPKKGLASMKGMTVALPVLELWGEDAPVGYDDVKTKKGRLLFRVVCPYRGKRLALCAIGKNGRTHRRKEGFTITAEQAMQWKS